MSFITKRERVFEDYDYDLALPARNEGKLKAYGSCTDARAWSHFTTDKSENLVDIIKRNNDRCAPKYVPTKVIVDTLMVTKNSEISRLKRKIEQFEQLLSAYDQLDLSDAQKEDIAKAHEAIKAAYKDLDDICLDLDLSGFTECVDSEAFETGKSRGDESEISRGDYFGSDASYWSVEKETKKQVDFKATQIGPPRQCDMCTFAKIEDPLIQEMQDTIISKDARLSAMQNTIAVMENDVCEPYCVYANINTALEKIYGILIQNDKYKQYLDLLINGKDIRFDDIKGKMLFKLKILEKFSLALVAPCSHGSNETERRECSCYHAQIYRVQTTYSLTTPEAQSLPPLDNKRTQLVADIMDSEEMKDLISEHDSKDDIIKTSDISDDFGNDTCSLDQENLKRLKKLQENYEDLVNCYENLKHERNCMELRCRRYNELEMELECLQSQLREYNNLWNEKEFYKKRSEEIDNLKQKYLLLSEEASNLETELKAEHEINDMKSRTIKDLKSANIALEQKLNEASITFEKERNTLQCKLKETECSMMCHEQQIRGLSSQIDRLLEEQEKVPDQSQNPIILLNEIATLKEQVRNLKDLLFCSEEEKRDIQEKYTDNLKLINELRMEIEDWKSAYEKTSTKNEYLEKYALSLVQENDTLSQEIKSKTEAVDNLIGVISTKSHEINKLLEDIERVKLEKESLTNDIEVLRFHSSKSMETIIHEKQESEISLKKVVEEKEKLSIKIKDYDAVIEKQESLTTTLQCKMQEYDEVKEVLTKALDENVRLKMEMQQKEDIIACLNQEVQRLKDINGYVIENINSTNSEKAECEKSLEIAKKNSEILTQKLSQAELASENLISLKENLEKVVKERNDLGNKLLVKNSQLDIANMEVELKNKESAELINKLQQQELLQSDYLKLNEAYQKLLVEKQTLHKELIEKDKELNSISKTLMEMDKESINKATQAEQNLEYLRKIYDELEEEKNKLQEDLSNQNNKIASLFKELESKIEENRTLINQVKSLQLTHSAVLSNLGSLETETEETKQALSLAKKESSELLHKLTIKEDLETLYNNLTIEFDNLRLEKESLQQELQIQYNEIRILQINNENLEKDNKNLLFCNSDLEKALLAFKDEMISKNESTGGSLTQLSKEIDEIKKEKILDHKTISELLDKLEESDNLISDLREAMLSRDSTIATLQNHKNELEEEIRKLHNDLEKVVSTSEEFQDNTFHKIEDSKKKIEAHHSKAAHNMKMELAQLQKHNHVLQEQLTVTKVKSEQSMKEYSKLLCDLAQLQNERNVITTELNQLERNTVGDSLLSPNNCTVDNIIMSMANINKSFERRSVENDTLRNKLLNIQTSSQLLISKADGAKTLVEKEKHKICNEKEEAIRKRLQLEKQMTDVQDKLNEQIKHNKDLEAEFMNQKLIYEQINQETQSYITELQGELESLRDLYSRAQDRISELQKSHNSILEENTKNQDLIEKINTMLETKTHEIKDLQEKFTKINSKTHIDVSVSLRNEQIKDQWTQVDIQTKDSFENTSWSEIEDTQQFNLKTKLTYADAADTREQDERYTNSLSKPYKLDDSIQILTANIEVEPLQNSINNKTAIQKYANSHDTHSIEEEEDWPGTHTINNNEKKHVSDDYLQSSIDNRVRDASHTEQQYSKDETNNTSSIGWKAKGNGNSIRSVENPPLFYKTENNNNCRTSVDNIMSFLNKDPETTEYLPTYFYEQDSKDIVLNQKHNNVHPSSKYIDNALHEDVTKEISMVSSQLPAKVINKMEENITKSIDSDHSENIYISSNHEQIVIDKQPLTNTKSTGAFVNVFSKKLTNSLIQATSECKQDKDVPKKDDTFSLLKTYSSDDSHQNISDTSSQYISQKNDMFLIYKDSDIIDPNNITQHKTPHEVIIGALSIPENNENKFSRVYRSGNINMDSKSHDTTEKLSEVKISPISLKSHSSDSSDNDDKYSSINNTYDQDMRDITKNYSEIHSLRTDQETKGFSSGFKIAERLSDTLKFSSVTSIPNDGIEHTTSPKLYTPQIDHSEIYDDLETILNPEIMVGNYESEMVFIQSDTHSEISGTRIENDFNNDDGRFLVKTALGSSNLLHQAPRRRHQKSKIEPVNNGLDYMLDTINQKNEIEGFKIQDAINSMRISQSNNIQNPNNEEANEDDMVFNISTGFNTSISLSKTSVNTESKTSLDKGVLVKIDVPEEYENQIHRLSKALKDVDSGSKNKIKAIKAQYDANIRNMINEHNIGVGNMQNLHEETLQDILKIHENEVENLRSMSIEAMKRADKIERENQSLKLKMYDISTSNLDQEPTRIPSPKARKRPNEHEPKTLTKTDVEAFDVKPKHRSVGPCTCSLDVNVSDTIRNIFEQVDVEQRRISENSYLKYIATKILNQNIETLDTEELAFLHFKVCRIWKSKMSKEEVLQKKIDTLEVELINKQKYAQVHIAELDRKVAEERRRLQEVREAVCRTVPVCSTPKEQEVRMFIKPSVPNKLHDKDISCNCDSEFGICRLNERRSAGDLTSAPCKVKTRAKRLKNETNRAVLAKIEPEERRERRLIHDEPPTRLRRIPDKTRTHKKMS